MYAMFDYVPFNSVDTRLSAVTSSTAAAGFPVTNLQDIKPVKSWKSTVVTESWVKYYFGAVAVSYRHVFLNRFNFAAFKIYISSNDADWTEKASVSGLTCDEIHDENYMHYWIDMGAGLSYKYIKIVIAAQTPLFETTYFKIGNFLVYNATEIWNPRAGFQVSIVPKESNIEFDSGYSSVYKLGRTKRIFSGDFDKISITEYNKIIKTRDLIVLYNDFEADLNKCYLVRSSKEMNRSYEMSDLVTHSFNYEEIV